MILISSFNLAISSSFAVKTLLIFSKFFGETSSNNFLNSQSLLPAWVIACIISCSSFITSSFNCFCEDSLALRSLCKLSNCSPSLRTRSSCSFNELFLSSSSFKSAKH
uniref:Myosin-11 n=1 Tax=Rhizophora mucronata TaxID=61149 RepID=A0A2P2K253_RHIMU